MHTVGLPRTCLGFTNMLFFVLAFIGFVICVWCAVNTEFFREVNYTVTKSASVGTIAKFMALKVWLIPITSILIPVSVVAMMTSCCGILGAGCKIKCAIKSYIFLVTVISSVAFWLFFISGIYNIYTNNEKTRKYLQSSIQNYYGLEEDIFTHLWNYTMVEYECCGAISYRDFATSKWQKANPDKIFPVQCCILTNKTSLIPISDNCTRNEMEEQSYKEMGCVYALRTSFINNKGSIIFYIILITMAYAILILFSYCIMRGEPLLGVMAEGISNYFPPKPKDDVNVVPSNSSLENMRFLDEPPQRLVKVVSAINPFQSYKVAPSNYNNSAILPH